MGLQKAGLNAITRSFAYALGPKVRVNCIMAGPFLTDISKAWDLDEFTKRAERTSPMKRGGEPDEIVGAALYLASDMATYTTGSIVAVDGVPTNSEKQKAQRFWFSSFSLIRLFSRGILRLFLSKSYVKNSCQK